MSLASDGRHLAVAELPTGELAVWDLEQSIPTRRVLPLFQANAEHQILDIAFAPTGNSLAVGIRLSSSEIGHLIIDTETGEVLTRSKSTKTDTQSPMQRLAFSADSTTLIDLQALGDAERGYTVMLWDQKKQYVRQTIQQRPKKPIFPNLQLAVSPAGNIFAVSNYPREGQLTVDFYQADNGSKYVESERISNAFDSLSFTRDGRYVMANCGAGHIIYVDSSTGMIAKEVHLTSISPVAAERAMAVSSDGRMLALASVDGIVLVDMESDAILLTLPFLNQMVRVNNVAISANQSAVTAVATTADGHCGVYVWRIPQPEEPK